MPFISKKTARSVPVTPIDPAGLQIWLKKQDAATRAWVAAAGYTGAGGSMLNIPGAKGIARILFGVDADNSLYTYAALPGQLPKNEDGYFIDKKMTAARATQAALGWALGSYAFTRYKGKPRSFAALVWPDNADRDAVTRTAEAIYFVRDLVNTPSNDLGPEELANAAENLLSSARATIKIIEGKELLKQNYPAIYEVGKGSARAPRLIDIRWGSAKNPRVTLVGKGVVFDTGGLNIKPGSAMALMKKDMGGAAHVLGLAHMIVSAKLPVNLRVLIPAVENAIDGNSFRPSDVIRTRKGLNIEIGDTDAEGRLVLSDALTEACREKPALLVDFATLTGAARVALGPEIPPLFSNNDKLAHALLESAGRTEDPLWRLPLWQPYRDYLGSKIADMNNSGGAFAGAITAALFLERFVDKDISWVHIDTYAWNAGSKPGRPEGGEALGIRAVFDMIKNKFGRRK